MNRTLLTITLLALLATTAVPMVSAARAEIQISTTTDPATSAPGTEGVFVFSLKNVGDTTAYGIGLTIYEIDEGISINNTQQAFVGGLGPAGSTTTSPFTFEIGQTTAPGFYHVTFQMDYSYRQGNDTNWGGSTFTATISVKDSATDFHVSAADGSFGALNVNVANIGVNLASGTLIEVLPAAGASQASSSSFLGDINPGDFTVATLTAAPTGAGASGNDPGTGAAGNSVFLRISYTDTAGQRQSVEKQMAMPTGSLGNSEGFQAGANGPGGPGQTTPWYESPYVIGVLLLVLAVGGGYVWSRRRSKNKYAKIEVPDKPMPSKMMWPLEQAPAADGPADWSEAATKSPQKRK